MEKNGSLAHIHVLYGDLIFQFMLYLDVRFVCANLNSQIAVSPRSKSKSKVIIPSSLIVVGKRPHCN
jgi:hypothetical protein